MDLRIQKTETAIKNAFLELRSRKPLEKISVKELCEKAQIHKSTFYDHYADVYALAETLETEITAGILESMPSLQLLVDDPGEFAIQLSYAYISQANLINSLFSGDQKSRLADRIEESVRKKLFALYPEYAGDLRAQVTLTFCIHGGYWAYQKNRENNLSKVIGIIGELSEHAWRPE